MIRKMFFAAVVFSALEMCSWIKLNFLLPPETGKSGNIYDSISLIVISPLKSFSLLQWISFIIFRRKRCHTARYVRGFYDFCFACFFVYFRRKSLTVSSSVGWTSWAYYAKQILSNLRFTFSLSTTLLCLLLLVDKSVPLHRRRRPQMWHVFL